MRKDMDGQTDMKKLTVTFRNFANAPKKCLQMVNRDCMAVSNVGQKTFQRILKKRGGKELVGGGGGFIWLGTGTSNRLL